MESSIKDSERQLRGEVYSTYTITGPEQTIRQSTQTLLSNSTFKNEFAKFLLKEWTKDHYWSLFDGKVLSVSHGGECYQYLPTDNEKVQVSKPAHLQGDHEEADTLIAFHIANSQADNVVVRASDTDVLIILVAMLGKLRPEVRSTKNVMIDSGTGNTRRVINVSNITDVLEELKPGLATALPALHAFTGSDYTSAFYRLVLSC